MTRYLNAVGRVRRVVRACVGACLAFGLAAGCGGSSTPGGQHPTGPDVSDALLGGRWWIDTHVEGQLVIHWSETDRSIWTQSERLPLTAHRNADGSSTLTSTAMYHSCHVARTTGDPDAIELWNCDAPRVTDQSLGLLRRGPPLIREISYDENPRISSNGQEDSLRGVDPTQRWVVVGVGDQLTLWKSDTDQRFDIGRGPLLVTEDNRPIEGLVEFSSDGRYVAYERPPIDDNARNALVLFDTMIGSERILEPRLDSRGTKTTASIARFSPDGRRIVFYGNLRDDGLHSDLVSVHIESGERVTLAENIIAQLLHDCLWFTRSDHVVFCADADRIFSSGEAPVRSYEYSTGARRDLGFITEMVTAPDGRYLTFTTLDGEIQLLEEADWTPRVLARTYDPSNPVRKGAFGGMTPSPDGRLLAFVDLNGAFNLYDTVDRTTHSVTDGAGCYASIGPAPGQEWAILSTSAFFLPDGRTVIHPSAPVLARPISSALPVGLRATT